MTKNIPGPFAPPLSQKKNMKKYFLWLSLGPFLNLPSLKITALSYSWTTWKMFSSNILWHLFLFLRPWCTYRGRREGWRGWGGRRAASGGRRSSLESQGRLLKEGASLLYQHQLFIWRYLAILPRLIFILFFKTSNQYQRQRQDQVGYPCQQKQEKIE